MAACFEGPPEEQVERIERVCAEHPDWSAEIRRRYRALCAMGFGPLDRLEPDLPDRLGDFRPIERLGAGGMGVVYRAEQLSLGRQVALKLVRPELLFFPGARERFRREVEAVARLDHPGIVPVYAVGEERGLPYFAMALVEGCTLSELLGELAGRDPSGLTGADLAAALQRRGIRTQGDPGSVFERPWTVACLTLVREIAEALAHAHSRGVVHRDVKPSNLALTSRGRAMLLDFGLTSSLTTSQTSSTGTERLTRTGTQPGTPHYMAPEQVRGEPVDARADVYALGVTLYELLTLRLPFEGSQLAAVRERILAGHPPAVRSLNRRVSRDAEVVCRTAMELDPERRYADASLFARDLLDAAEGRAIQARPPGAVLRSVRWIRRHPTASASTALGLALLGGLPTGLYLQQRGHASELGRMLTRESAALKREADARGTLETANSELARSVERERDLREKESTARADAETTIAFLGNLFLDLTPERLRGRTFDLREWLKVSDEGRAALADRPGVLGRILMLSGSCYLSLGDLDRAIETLGEAVEIEREHSGQLSEWTLLAVDRLATTLQQRGRLDEAEGFFHEALEGQILLRGPRSSAAAIEHNNLGNLLLQKGDLAGAEPHLSAALEISAENPGGDPATVPILRGNLAMLFLRLGRLDEAEAAIDRALSEVRAVGEGQPVELARILNNAGLVRLAQEDFAGAETVLAEAVAIYDRIYQAPDLYAAAAQHNLGSALSGEGRVAEALPSLERAVDSMEKLGLASHANTVRYRATLAKARAAGSESP